jgi:spermidine synthase
VLATGEGMQKRLLVNGVGMTTLTPITKVMAHLPLALLQHRPQNALIICFGMGTTYRSFLSWGIPTTAVELVPSVPRLFGYYHPDGPKLLESPLSHVIIDVGRRYLERTSDEFDVIAIDPPPPVEAAGSSLLYSKDFYSEIKKHLRPGGILQQWLPEGDAVVRASVAKSIYESFAHVRIFRSVDNRGFHFLASNYPIASFNSYELAEKLPESASADFTEWGPAKSAEDQFDILLRNEISLQQMISDDPDAPALNDDRPMNEYFAWRRLHSRGIAGVIAAQVESGP